MTLLTRSRPRGAAPVAAPRPVVAPRPVRRAVAGLNRVAVAGLLGATGVAGLLFAPVFPPAALAVPLLVVLGVGYGCVEAAARWPRLEPWRPVLVLVAGLLGLTEAVLFPTTLLGLPTGATLSALTRGLTQSWLLTLQSTWPARPDPDQLLFVPLAVLLAVLLGLELLLRLRRPLLSLLPGLAVVGLAQAYQATGGVTGVLAAAGYTAPAALLLWADRPSRTGPAARQPRTARGTRRLTLPTVGIAALTAVAVLAGAVALGALDPADRDPYQLRAGRTAPVRPNPVSNPLDQIADRLAHPDREVFRYRSATPVDRWRLAVLDTFDGANWTADTRLRRLGVTSAAPPGDTTRTADVRLTDLAGPWLPSQQNPLGVTGVAPLVDQTAGTLLLDPPPAAGQRTDYQLAWSEPAVDPADLGVAPVDSRAPGGSGDLGPVPPDLAKLASDAVLGLRPTFQSALQLERYLAKNYQVANYQGGADSDLPTGHGWPQLRHFLTVSRRGTSEQFAAAYVVLARLTGIPARLAVGFRGATSTDGGYTVVRDGDVLAWPEVAVAGVGWVPLDPTASARHTGAATGDALAAAADQARSHLPSEQDLRPPQLPQPAARSAAADAGSGWWAREWGWVVAVVIAALLVGWLLGVPAAKALRRRHRRRRTGADGVVGAWSEARDRLRGHGVPYRVGMTARDLAESTRAVVGEPTAEPIVRLARVLDMALWSGVPVTDGAVRRAWDEVTAVRRSLGATSWSTRLRAAVDPRTLIPPTARH